MFRGGRDPIEVAKLMGVSVRTTLPYLNEWVGKGEIRRSDIYFSVEGKTRSLVRKEWDGFEGQEWEFLREFQKKHGWDARDYLHIVLAYGDARTAYGDMYQDLRDVELRLHHLVREALSGSNQLAAGEDWWARFVPIQVRQDCTNRRGQDKNPSKDLFVYTDIMHLRCIIDVNWSIIGRALSESGIEYRKHDIVFDLKHLNDIRRVVMHPVRGPVPNEEDFDFVRRLRRSLGHAKQARGSNAVPH